MSNNRHAPDLQPTDVDEAAGALDLGAVRAFLAVLEDRSFSEAAARLGISQQAVSKRIARLEKNLGVRLFTRELRGAQLTIDGQAFTPHARELLRVEERALASVHPGSRALRIDVLNLRIGPAALLRDFHRAYPETDLDVVTLAESDVDAAIAAVKAGTIDASFRAVTTSEIPPDIETSRVLDDPHQLLTGPAHQLATARAVTPAQLVSHRIWMPGIVPGREWTTYYDDLAAAFGLTIERIGPNFGTDHLLEVLADSKTLASLVGEQTRLIWPAHYDLRRIPVVNPTPVYPHSLIWRRTNPHPGLATLRHYIRTRQPRHQHAETWAPTWATRHG